MFEDDFIPNETICPITLQLMTCSVNTTDERVYEQEAIEQSIIELDSSFSTEQPLQGESLNIDDELQDDIEDFLFESYLVQLETGSPKLLSQVDTLTDSLAASFVQAIEQSDIRRMHEHLRNNRWLLTQPLIGDYTAFHMACEASSFEALHYLCDCLGADLRAAAFPIPKRWLPRHLNALFVHGCSTQSIDLVALMLELGVDVNRAYPRGYTALHRAIHDNNYALTKLLLAFNAHLEIKDYQGNTPLHVATIKGYTALASLLLSYGARPDGRYKQKSAQALIQQPNNHLASFITMNHFTQRRAGFGADLSKISHVEPNISSPASMPAISPIAEKQQVAHIKRKATSLAESKAYITTSVERKAKRTAPFFQPALAPAEKTDVNAAIAASRA